VGTPPTWTKQTVNYTWGPGVDVPTVQCTMNFSIPNNMFPPVLFYYRLTNFYQNHRRYAKSFNTDQLSGQAVSADSVGSSDCTPLTTLTEPDGHKKPYYPCGLAPNSLFNDTFSSPIMLNAGGTNTPKTYSMKNNSGIAWSSDKALYGESKYKSNWSDVAVPPNWVLRYPQNYTDDYHPDLVNDEAFQVWMRLAGLPTFSKLAQRNDDEIMLAGEYSVAVNHSMSLPTYFENINSHSPQTSQ
jgi:hypothetical protein